MDTPKAAPAFSCGFGTTVLSTKGGPSLDWVLHEATKTETPLPTLSLGFSGGDDIAESVRYHHSWRGKNQPNEVILDTLKAFQAIFGGQIWFRWAPCPTLWPS